jgi:hypothetical protein
MMGTNFYVAGHRGDDPHFHVGKRSAAGWYCWDCRRTLCIEGEAKIHFGGRLAGSCPSCGKEPEKESLETSAAGRELGFNKSEPGKLVGVRSACSFTWAMPWQRFREVMNDMPEKCFACQQPLPGNSAPAFPFEDEYGRAYSVADFLSVLDGCPIVFRDSVGERFS